jgi:hypothetical protein
MHNKDVRDTWSIVYASDVVELKRVNRVGRVARMRKLKFRRWQFSLQLNLIVKGNFGYFSVAVKVWLCRLNTCGSEEGDQCCDAVNTVVNRLVT